MADITQPIVSATFASVDTTTTTLTPPSTTHPSTAPPPDNELDEPGGQYFLVLLHQTSGGNSIAVAPVSYNTEEDCEHAGAFWDQSSTSHHDTRTHVCIPAFIYS